MGETYFDHERLEVYRLGRQFNRELQPVLGVLPRGAAESRDNLTRAAKSITRNLAEGGGRWTIADKMHFYHIARASATECAAALDELVDFALVSADRVKKPKHTLSRIVAMLINMIRSLESRSAAESTSSRHRSSPTMSRPRTTRGKTGTGDMGNTGIAP